MASPGSTKDLAKAIHSYIQDPVVPLPSELSIVIESYLDKHEKFDEAASDRLNDELNPIYQKHVHGNPSKYAAFLAILRPLRPAIRTPARLLQWWDRLFEPVLAVVDHEKGLAQEALQNVLDLVTTEGDEDTGASEKTGLNAFADSLLSRWMQLCVSQEAGVSAADHWKESFLKQALLIFGKKAPKRFMSSLNNYVVKRDYRNQALNLLCDFIQSQPPHLHLAVQTPLFSNVLQSLQKDTSTSTVSTALAALFMLMPYMPSSLVTCLPTLFNIYARLLFWDRDRQFDPESTEYGIELDGSDLDDFDDVTWEKCLFDPDYDGHSITHLSLYFTMLYGLYPINFMDYIRKPQRYLRHANNSEDIDVQATEIRDRSERFRQAHLLHPNFYTLTIESELTDLGRFIKSEADEVLADCMALHVERVLPDTNQGTAPIPGVVSPSTSDGMDREGLDHTLLSAPGVGDTLSVRESALVNGQPTQSTIQEAHTSASSQQSTKTPDDAKPRDVAGDSPTLPAHLDQSSSQTQLQDMIHSNKMLKSGLHQSLANDSVPSLSLSHQDSVAEKTIANPPQAIQPVSSAGSIAETAGQISQLYQRCLLLQNDLQFERYIKQQHMTHIGELRRKQVREAATEAETQNLVMGNRNLRHRLEEAKKGEMQFKKEADNRRNMTKKWELDFSTKLKALREEQKKWALEEGVLKRDLEAAKAESERLRKAFILVEEQRLKLEQDLEAVDINADEIDRLKEEVARLSISERKYQGKELEMRNAIESAEVAEARAEQLAVDLVAREEQIRQIRQSFESQMVLLNTKLSEALQEKQKRQNTDVAAVYESALAASRAKQAELQKKYSSLTRKYTVLQSSLLDIQCDVAERRMRAKETASSPDADFDAGAVAGSPVEVRGRAHRGFSDPETFDPTSYHTAKTPLEQLSSSVGPGTPRPSTPITANTEPPEVKGSPQGSDRYFGRGGVQNTIRKDRKEKKEDKPDKKEKKGSGIRGIRGFV